MQKEKPKTNIPKPKQIVFSSSTNICRTLKVVKMHFLREMVLCWTSWQFYLLSHFYENGVDYYRFWKLFWNGKLYILYWWSWKMTIVSFGYRSRAHTVQWCARFWRNQSLCRNKLSNYYFCRAWISVGLCPSFTQNLYTLHIMKNYLYKWLMT